MRRQLHRYLAKIEATPYQNNYGIYWTTANLNLKYTINIIDFLYFDIFWFYYMDFFY